MAERFAFFRAWRRYGQEKTPLPEFRPRSAPATKRTASVHASAPPVKETRIAGCSLSIPLASRAIGYNERISYGEPAMPTTTIRIIGMKSDECLRSVMNAIQDLPCIGDVEVLRETGEATIEHSAMVSEGDIRQIIEDAGYPTA
jgi:copper chaperone CopZ